MSICQNEWNIKRGLWATIVRELKQLVSRPIYVLCMVGAPLFSCIFLLSLMHEGLPHKIPVAIVDHDHTSTSRNFYSTAWISGVGRCCL